MLLRTEVLPDEFCEMCATSHKLVVRIHTNTTFSEDCQLCRDCLILLADKLAQLKEAN